MDDEILRVMEGHMSALEIKHRLNLIFGIELTAPEVNTHLELMEMDGLVQFNSVGWGIRGWKKVV